MRRLALTAACFALFVTSCRSAGVSPARKAASPGSPGTPEAGARTLMVSPLPLPTRTGGPPDFSATISAFAPERVKHSWRPGCPVPRGDLRLLSLRIWGFDERAGEGEIVIHRAYASDIVDVMKELFELRFPIAKMNLIDEYGGDDEKSMEANNTSAFNCREVSGRPGAWSEHAFGRAIDINPVQNPYISGSGEVSPASGKAFVQRNQRAKGMIHPHGPVVKAFKSKGWEWGGNWDSPRDFQHFSVSGR